MGGVTEATKADWSGWWESIADPGLRWVAGSRYQPEGSSLLSSSIPDPHPREGQMFSWSLRAAKARQIVESRLR